jgi:hypothetical protein
VAPGHQTKAIRRSTEDPVKAASPARGWSVEGTAESLDGVEASDTLTCVMARRFGSGVHRAWAALRARRGRYRHGAEHVVGATAAMLEAVLRYPALGPSPGQRHHVSSFRVRASVCKCVCIGVLHARIRADGLIRR